MNVGLYKVVSLIYPGTAEIKMSWGNLLVSQLHAMAMLPIKMLDIDHSIFLHRILHSAVPPIQCHRIRDCVLYLLNIPHSIIVCRKCTYTFILSDTE